jgi:hypothetical protein
MVDWKGIGETFAIGGTGFYGIHRILKTVEDTLSDNTKLEIGDWLSGVKTERAGRVMSSVMGQSLEAAFGPKQLTLFCLWRSVLATALLSLFALLVFPPAVDEAHSPVSTFLYFVAVSVLPVYIGIAIARTAARLLIRVADQLWLAFMVLYGGMFYVFLITVVCMWPIVAVANHSVFPDDAAVGVAGMFMVAFVAYATVVIVTAQLTRAAHHIDIGLAWFSRKFDVKGKPLPSLAIISGTAVSVVCWIVGLAVVFRH